MSCRKLYKTGDSLFFLSIPFSSPSSSKSSTATTTKLQGALKKKTNEMKEKTYGLRDKSILIKCNVRRFWNHDSNNFREHLIV